MYKILKEVHRGGQGVVYKAIQQSTQRTVAIKVMREGPFASSSDKARFDREVQVLGQLNHPNIVAIHDTGVAAGCHFFVMDYVAGQTLDVYMAGGRQQRPVNEALRLFEQICDAVNAAHLRGVIHRDLKPANIRIDAEGRPHVLDFGLAKVATRDDMSAMTMTGQFVGSLPWASPEQAEGVPSKIDLRTDVYSLGVVLYQMLTGRFPYEVIGPMRDVLDQIMTAEPARPRSIRKQINDEVETIVLKCLSKERERRYQTAGELGRDVQRFLSGEPIEAKRDSPAYVLRKQLSKHKLSVAVAAAFMLVVTGGFVTSLAFWRQSVAKGIVADQRRAEAETERERAKANLQKARDAVDQMLTEVGDKKLANVPGVAPIRRALLERALEFHKGFLDEESDDPAVRLETAQAYERLGRVHALLGQHEQVNATYRSAIALFEGLLADDPKRVAYREKLATVLHNLALAGPIAVGDLAEAEQLYRRSQALYEQLLAEFPDELRYLSARGHILRNLGTVLLDKRRLREAEQIFLTALDLQERLIAQAPDKAEYRANQGRTCRVLGRLYTGMDRPSEAEHQLGRAVSIAKSLVVDFPENPDYRQGLSLAHSALEQLLHRLLGRLEEAAAALRDAIVVSASLVRDFPNVPMYRGDLAKARSHLAGVLSDIGRTEEAEREFGLAVDLYTKLVEDSPNVPFNRSYLAQTHNGLGSHFLSTRRLPDAEQAFRQAADLQEKLVAEFPDFPGYRDELGSTYGNLGIVFAETAKPVDAADAFGKSVYLFEVLAAEFPDAPQYRQHLVKNLSNQGRLLRIVDRIDDAEAAFRKCVALSEQLAANSPTVPYYRMLLAANLNSLGGLLHKTDRQAEAADVYKRALAAWQALSADFPKHHEYQRSLAKFLLDCRDDQFQDADRALEAAARAVELAPKDGNARTTLGEAHYRAENWQEAIAESNASMQLRNGGDSMERFLTAMAHWRLGNKDQARHWYDQGVRWIEENNSVETWHESRRADAAELLGLDQDEAAEPKEVPPAQK